MTFYRRKNIRLPDYDYSQEGGYFITICTQNRRCVLSAILDNGECENAGTKLTELGRLAETTLRQITERYDITLDCFVIMPNHIHAILFFKRNQQEITVGRCVGAFKSVVVHRWIERCKALGVVSGKLWQRNYYEHIIRNEQDYLEKRKYIEENPDKWLMDDEYAEN